MEKIPEVVQEKPAPVARNEAAKSVVLAKERSGGLGDIGLAG